MVDPALSVLARLNNCAKSSGRSHQLCLQLFCQEEFLRRLSMSKYVGNFVLKGGLFLYYATNFDSRVTLDIDFLMKNLPNKCDVIREILEEIIHVKTPFEFIEFELLDVSQISVEKKYAGVSATLIAIIKNTRTRFHIDLGVGDIVIPTSQVSQIPTQLQDFLAPAIHVYSLESTIAEKLDAALFLMEFSSRMKDYFDIYYLAKNFEFSLHSLAEALKRTLDNRGHAHTPERFQQFIQLRESRLIQQRWTAFSKKIGEAHITCDEVFSVLKQFLSLPLQRINNFEQSTECWNPHKQCWFLNNS